MTSTSNSSSSSSSTGGGSDSSNSADIVHYPTNRIVNMSSSDGNSNDTPSFESSSFSSSSLTPNNVELEFKKITGDRNGWQLLYQVSWKIISKVYSKENH